MAHGELRHAAGEPIDAARAWQLGIVSSIHDPDDLGAAAAELAGKLAASATFALAQLKQVIDHAADAPTNAVLENEVSAFALCFDHPDQQEGVKAFLEKRPPRFRGN